MSRCLSQRFAAVAAILLFVLAALAAGPKSWGQAGAAREDKIRGDIYYHQKLKQRPPGRSVADHQRTLLAARIDGTDSEREAITIYVTERLSKADIAVLRTQGIEIDPNFWIPPLPGSHPLGFHLGLARYDSLPILARDKRVVRVDSAEAQSSAQNDVGGSLINVNDVHAGTGLFFSRNGAGVRIAIADSGVDLTHPDLSAPAETFDVTTSIIPENWSTIVRNQVQNHGTHVVGTVLGSGGLSGGRYVGGAPGATWAFYKIGNDVTSAASIVDQVKAINRAATLGYDIFTMSYGGFSDFFMDGSGPMEQAIDTAVAGGMTVFIAAGNSGAAGQHASMNLAPQTTSAAFGFTVVNGAAVGALTAPETIRVIWRDNDGFNINVSLTCSNLVTGESLTLIDSRTSVRGPEARQYSLTPNIAAGTQKTYSLVLSNTAPVGGSTPLVHLYAASSGTFNTPDPAFTIGSPAIADGAIAVGAWVHRATWTSFTGAATNFGETAGGLATFSSRGPRIDGRLKPDLVAPGTATISLLDANNGTFPPATMGRPGPIPNNRIIDNDGLNLNGSGPANYAVMQGTSMACPMAAGVAALVLQENPGLNPAQLREILTLTALSADSPNNSVGYGLIDALAAVREAALPAVWVDFNYPGPEHGTFTEPFNSFAEGVAAVPVSVFSPFPFTPRLRIKSGTSPGTAPPISTLMQVESFGGQVTIGQQ